KTNCVAVPALIVTLPEVPADPPVAAVAVNVPLPAVPVYFIPNVRLATPLLKSPAPLSLLPPARPEIVPLNGALAAIVTLLAEASKLVVFPNASCATNVFAPVKTAPLLCGLVRLNANLFPPAADTATVNRSLPLALIDPSVALIVAVSAL